MGEMHMNISQQKREEWQKTLRYAVDRGVEEPEDVDVLGGIVKTSIEVADRKEAAQIRAGLEDPEVRVFVKAAGILQGLESPRAQRRVLAFVADSIADTLAKGL